MLYCPKVSIVIFCPKVYHFTYIKGGGKVQLQEEKRKVRKERQNRKGKKAKEKKRKNKERERKNRKRKKEKEKENEDFNTEKDLGKHELQYHYLSKPKTYSQENNNNKQ